MIDNLIWSALHLHLSLMHYDNPVRPIVNKVEVMGGNDEGGFGGGDRREELAQITNLRGSRKAQGSSSKSNRGRGIMISAIASCNQNSLQHARNH